MNNNENGYQNDGAGVNYTLSKRTIDSNSNQNIGFEITGVTDTNTTSHRNTSRSKGKTDLYENWNNKMNNELLNEQ